MGGWTALEPRSCGLACRCNDPRFPRPDLASAAAQSNINTPGFRSLREGEEVEFDLAEAQDGKKKAFNVTGPGGAPVQVG